MGFLRWLLRRGPRIEAHTLGVLDLSGGTAGALMAADRTALAPLFRRASESTDAPPRRARSLREIIRDAGVPVVVVATPNSGQSYTVAANRNKQLARANLVMTLDRKGETFAHFFRRLVADMKQGTSQLAFS